MRVTLARIYGRGLLSYCRVRRRFSTETHSQECQEVGNRRDHVPVMVEEVIKYLKPQEKSVIIDMTFGAGGHSKAILNENSNVTIIALDRDPVGHEMAVRLSEQYPGKIIPLLGKFSELPELLQSKNINQNSIDGMLFDFGCSSMQFDSPRRGFAVSKDGPLDMRMDGDRFPDQPTAMDVLSRAREEDLAKIFKVYGEEKNYKKIARVIVESRYLFRNLTTTKELGDLVNSVFDDDVRFDKLGRPAHNATKVFQALRIFVNDELNEINHGIHVASRYLKIGGRLVTLTFHSLEDTIVKRHITGNIAHNNPNALPLKFCDHMRVFEKDDVISLVDPCWQSLIKHVVVPSLQEIGENPRCRSCKLRAAIRIK